MKKDMNIQGLILEDFWWKNSGIRSWDGGYTDHRRFIEGRRMSRLREIICEILDGGEVVVKVWVGFGVTLVFLEIF